MYVYVNKVDCKQQVIEILKMKKLQGSVLGSDVVVRCYLKRLPGVSLDHCQPSAFS